MNARQRSSYFLAWAHVCEAQGWNSKDNSKRQGTTAACMAAIGGPTVSSTSELAEDEITALFCFLQHLADPASLDKSARWDTCRQDYKTFARARNADWHEEQLYGRGKNKLDRNRFKGEASASRGPLEELDPEEVRKRHLTMASRHQRAARKKGLPKPKADSPSVNAPAPVQAPAPASAARTSAPVVPEPSAAGWDGVF